MSEWLEPGEWSERIFNGKRIVKHEKLFFCDENSLLPSFLLCRICIKYNSKKSFPFEKAVKEMMNIKCGEILTAQSRQRHGIQFNLLIISGFDLHNGVDRWWLWTRQQRRERWELHWQPSSVLSHDTETHIHGRLDMSSHWTLTDGRKHDACDVYGNPIR